jgi:hypothetical protein
MRCVWPALRLTCSRHVLPAAWCFRLRWVSYALALRLLLCFARGPLSFSIGFPLLLLKLAHLLFSFSISFRSFTCETIDLLFPCDVFWFAGSDRSRAALVSDIKLLFLYLVRYAFDTEPPG